MQPPSSERKRGRPSKEAAGKLADEILEAALATLLAGGIDKLTMARVAQYAGVSKKTMYTRFKDKKDLVAFLICYTLNRYIWDDGRKEEENSIKERVFAAVSQILKNTLEPEMIAVEEAIQRYPELEYAEGVRLTRQIPVSIVCELLLEAKANGFIGFEDALIPAYALLDAIVLGSRVRFLYMTEEERSNHPVDTEARPIFELIWRGMLVT